MGSGKVMKHIGILTSGGDAPGMNCAIRAAVRTAIGQGIEVTGILRGFRGLYENDFIPLNSRSVSGIINAGGTILRTIRFPGFLSSDIRRKCFANLQSAGIEGLIVIGGDGSAHGAHALCKEFNFPVVHIPASIDNDLFGTDETIGFDTAVNTAVDAIDRIRDTATSHERIFIVEVMGREHGFLALEIAIAAGAEVVMLPELPMDIDDVIAILEEDRKRGKISSLVIVAEGAGRAHNIAEAINRKMPGSEARYSVLGYIQRGGRPTYKTRVLATMFGCEAASALVSGVSDMMVGVSGGKLVRVPLETVIHGHLEISREKLELLKKMAV